MHPDVHAQMKERLTDEQIRDVRAENRERITTAKIRRLRIFAVGVVGERHTAEERAAANAEANRLAAILRARRKS